MQQPRSGWGMLVPSALASASTNQRMPAQIC